MPRSLCSALLIPCMLLFAACGGADPESRKVPAETPRITDSPPDTGAEEDEGPTVVFLGDSITAGLHLEGGKSEAFPDVAARLARKEGWRFRAVNSGKSGDTSAGGRRKVSWVLKMEPDLVVVELGGNDGLRGQPLTAIEDNLRAIVSSFQDRGVGVILLGMEMPPSYGEEYAQGYADIYRKIAEDRKIPWVPGFMQGVGGVPDLNYRDGLHPNRAGHVKLAEKILPTLRESVKSLSRVRVSAPR